MFSSIGLQDSHSEDNSCDLEGGVVHSIFSQTEIRRSTFLTNEGPSGGAWSCNSNSTCMSSYNSFISNIVSMN